MVTTMVSKPTLSQSQMKVNFKVYPSQVKNPTSIFRLKIVLSPPFVQVKAISAKYPRLLIELVPSLEIQVDPNKPPTSFSLWRRAVGFLSKSKPEFEFFSLQQRQAFVATIAFTFLLAILRIYKEAGNTYSNLGDDIDNDCLSFFPFLSNNFVIDGDGVKDVKAMVPAAVSEAIEEYWEEYWESHHYLYQKGFPLPYQEIAPHYNLVPCRATNKYSIVPTGSCPVAKHRTSKITLEPSTLLRHSVAWCIPVKAVTDKEITLNQWLTQHPTFDQWEAVFKTILDGLKDRTQGYHLLMSTTWKSIIRAETCPSSCGRTRPLLSRLATSSHHQTHHWATNHNPYTLMEANTKFTDNLAKLKAQPAALPKEDQDKVMQAFKYYLSDLSELSLRTHKTILTNLADILDFFEAYTWCTSHASNLAGYLHVVDPHSVLVAIAFNSQGRTDSNVSFESFTRKNGYDSPEAALVMKSFRYAVPENHGRQSQLGSDDTVGHSIAISHHKHLNERPDPSTNLHSGCKDLPFRAHSMDESNLPRSPKIQSFLQQGKLEIHLPLHVSHIGAPPQGLESGSQAGSRQISDNAGLPAGKTGGIRKEQEEVMKELRSLKGQGTQKRILGFSPTVDSQQEVKIDASQPVYRHHKTRINQNPTKTKLSLTRRSTVDKARCAHHEPPPGRSDATTGRMGLHSKTMWEWDELHTIIRITGSQGKLSRGKKQKRTHNLHDEAVPMGNKPINFVLPLAIQTTLHQVLSSRAYTNHFVPESKSQQRNSAKGWLQWSRKRRGISLLHLYLDKTWITRQLAVKEFGDLLDFPSGRVNWINDECILDLLIDLKTPGKVLAGAVWFLGSNQTGSTPPGEGVVEAVGLKVTLVKETLKAKDKDCANAVMDKAAKSVPKHLWNGKIAAWFHLNGKLSLNGKEIEQNGLRACGIADDCSWWNWEMGSSIFFWRWPWDYQETAQLGLEPMFDAPALSNEDQQQLPYSDPKIKALVKEKLTTFLETMMFMLRITKGEQTNIHIVYDGTKPDLNNALYAPWYALPMVFNGQGHPKIQEPTPQRSLDDSLPLPKLLILQPQGLDGCTTAQLTNYLGSASGAPPLMPFGAKKDPQGYLACAMLLRSREPNHNAQCMQFETVRKCRSVFTNFVHTCPDGVGFVSTTMTNSLSFKRFTTGGCHRRMGDVLLPDDPVTLEIMDATLDYMEEKWQGKAAWIDMERFNFTCCAVMFLDLLVLLLKN
eukprot:jgi/Psemu1/25705/gm1.25705_g